MRKKKNRISTGWTGYESGEKQARDGLFPYLTILLILFILSSLALFFSLMTTNLAYM
jgi:hypothetical protein